MEEGNRAFKGDLCQAPRVSTLITNCILYERKDPKNNLLREILSTLPKPRSICLELSRYVTVLMQVLQGSEDSRIHDLLWALGFTQERIQR